MPILKCKMCGGDLNVAENEKVVECEYCGSKQTLPSANDEIIANLHNRANTLRLKCEFDKAEEIYNKILEKDSNDAEAHWGVILCKYGIEYVEDPKTYNRIPTCHRTSFEAILADEDYKAAVTCGSEEQRQIYEAEAKEIDRIQKDILAIVKDEKPFDVFICYKETDENGKRTQDSVIANDIYYQLTQEGFKVFYAAITLEDKLGQEYEPYIFAALNSAKVMLVVGSKPEYFSAVWVKNEWSRYLKLMKTDRSKLLIPCYKDIDAYELPEEFAHLQAQNMAKIGFINDLVRGIKKVVADSAPKTTVKETVVVNNSNTAPLLKRAFMFLEDGNWQEADEYCEKVLDIDPENAEAYLGKLMAELKVTNRKKLADCAKPFNDRDNYSKVLRFGDEALEKEMRGYITHINERNENAEREYKVKIKNIAKALISHEDSASFEKRKEQLQSEIVLLERKIIEFPSKPERASVVKENINTLSSQKASLNLKKSNLGFFKIKEKQEIDENISEIDKKINTLQGELQILESEIDEYKSVAAIEVLTAEKQKKLDELISDSTLCSDLSISYEDAIKELSSNDSLRSDVFAAYPKLRWIMAKVRDYVEFGKYHQTASGKDSTPIQWRVLAKENNRVLIISEKALDCQQYNTSYTDVTWEYCSLRKWMNGTFLNNAFSAEEQALIQNTNVSADKNPNFSTNPGNTTSDKVFLLSITEAGKYFSTDESRKCAPTAFAKAQGAFTNDRYKTASGEATCSWWLRSPGGNQDRAAKVSDGPVGYNGYRVHGVDVCVRPALWINLDS